jgi:hypothetical protein
LRIEFTVPDPDPLAQALRAIPARRRAAAVRAALARALTGQPATVPDHLVPLVAVLDRIAAALERGASTPAPARAEPAPAPDPWATPADPAAVRQALWDGLAAFGVGEDERP